MSASRRIKKPPAPPPSAVDDYLAAPSEAGAREIGRLAAIRLAQTRHPPAWAPPVEPQHLPAYHVGFALERLRQETLPEVAEPRC